MLSIPHGLRDVRLLAHADLRSSETYSERMWVGHDGIVLNFFPDGVPRGREALVRRGFGRSVRSAIRSGDFYPGHDDMYIIVFMRVRFVRVCPIRC